MCSELPCSPSACEELKEGRAAGGPELRGASGGARRSRGWLAWAAMKSFIFNPSETAITEIIHTGDVRYDQTYILMVCLCLHYPKINI